MISVDKLLTVSPQSYSCKDPNYFESNSAVIVSVWSGSVFIF